MLAIAILLGVTGAGPAVFAEPAARDRDTLVALDVKDGTAVHILQALAEAGGLQLVADPGLACRLTLKLNGTPLDRAFEAVLRACTLGVEGEGNVLRVATTARLRQEAADRRRLAEAQQASAPRQEVRLRLSYARAAEMAPRLKPFLSPRGEAIFDERTNTLILLDPVQR